MTLRFARWAAVSTREQAKPGKRSIPNQLESTLQAGAEHGWEESAGPFIVEGQSREIYIDLSEAEREIPALRQMLQSARLGEFDILILTETDRLRSLQVAVLRRLASYHVQLYIVNLPVEPVSPSEYTIHRADNILMLLTMTQMTSSLEISRTRRKWYENMPRRVTELGIPATGIPYGYRKPPGQELDHKAIPEPDSAITARIIEMKDLLLSGASSYQIAETLQKSLLAPPRGKQWHAVTVRDILKNPFYAGIVQWGKSRIILDPKTDTRKRNRSIPQAEIRQAQGRHIPLWDMDTHRAILAEFQKRTRNYRGRANNQFTGLLKCGVCGKTLWRQGNGPRGDYRLIWRCSASGSGHGHINIPHVILLEKLGTAIGEKLATMNGELKNNSLQPTADNSKPTANNSQQLERKLQRLEDAYLDGSWELEKYKRRRAELMNELQRAQDDTDRQREETAQRAEILRSITSLQGEDLPHWLTHTDPGEVNHTLKAIIREIIIGDEIQVVMK